MKVEVRCRFWGRPGEKVIRRGELECVPRVDERVCLTGDDAAESVSDVIYELSRATAIVYIRSASPEDYPEVTP